MACKRSPTAAMPPYFRRFSCFCTTTSYGNTAKPKSNASLYPISDLLKFCRTPIDLQQVHARLIQKGLEQDHFLVTQFISASNSVAHISYSTSVFDRVLSPTTFLWNSLVRGYCEKLQFLDTISLFVRMKRRMVFLIDIHFLRFSRRVQVRGR